MKKMFVLLGLLLLCAPAFTGGQQEAEVNETVTLTVWDFKYGEVETTGPVMKEIDELFMDQNPGIIINHVAQPSAEAYYNLIRTAAASGRGPDLFMTHGGSSSWEFEEVQVKLDELVTSWRDQISEASWQFAATDGDLSKGIRQVPLTSQGFGIYYNKELFAKAGLDPDNPPREWDDFKSACTALKDAGIVPIMMPNTPTIATEWTQRFLSLNFYDNDDIKGFVDGTAQFTDPEMKIVAQSLKEIMDSDWIGEADKSLHMFKEGMPTFKEGGAAMIVGLLSDIVCWKDYSDALGKDNVGYFPNINLPENKYDDVQLFQPVGIGYSIASWSENVDAAAKYLEFYSAGDGAFIFASKLGALVPNVNLDLSSSGYGAFSDVQAALSNVSSDYATIVGKAGSDHGKYMELFYNIDEINIDEYLANLQKSVIENYME